MIAANGEPLPIEIKYGRVDFKGLLAFMEKFKIDEGLIVSYEIEETRKIDGKTIRIIPAFKYLAK